MVRLELYVGGAIYGGWKSAEITLSMEHGAGAYSLTVSERWPGQLTARPIHNGEACRLVLDGETVITGYVDDVVIDYDAASHQVTVSGRDATGDLVDCSAPAVQWSGRSLEDVARELCRPFGIGVVVQAASGGLFESLVNKEAKIEASTSFSRLKSNEGDTVWETLEAAARIRAVLLTSDGLGNLVITRASTERISTVLELGQNVLKGHAQYSDKERYRDIRVKGQGAGGDDWAGEEAAHSSGHAHDPRIARHRPFTLLAEEQSEGASAQERAEWERDVRYGRSRQVTYTVPGWRHAEGLWRPNRLVRVRDGFLGLDQDLLLVTVKLVLDGQGQRAELMLQPREAYTRIAEAEPDADGMGDI